MYSCLQEVRPKFTSQAQELELTTQMRQQIRVQEEALEAGRAVLSHVVMLIVHRACSDPGSRVVKHAVLPIIQERLERMAKEQAATIRQAQEELINAEVIRTDLTHCNHCMSD